MAQGKPIPTRFDDATVAMLDQLNERTGLSKSDLIRRAIAYALRHIEESGDISVLYENPSQGTAPLPQRPVTYQPKRTSSKARKAS